MTEPVRVLVVAADGDEQLTAPLEAAAEVEVVEAIAPAAVAVGVRDHPAADCLLVVASEDVDVPALVDAAGSVVPVVVADVDPARAAAALAAGADEVVEAGARPAVLSHRVTTVGTREERDCGADRYRTLVETVGDAMYVLDDEGYLVYVNDAHVELSGYDRERLVGSHVMEFMPAEAVERGTEVVQDLLDDPDKRWGRCEFSARRPDGERRHYEDNIAVRTDGAGEFTGTVGVVRDITDRKRAERQLAQQNRRLEQFTSAVSHDLRNPTNVARGHLETGLAEGDLAHHVEEALTSLDRMEQLVEDVLALASDGKAVSDPESLDLESLARDAWSSVATGEATLAVTGSGTLRGDRSRLLRLFGNLFRNAVEHGSTSPQQAGDAVEHGSTSSRPKAEDSVEQAGPAVAVTVGPLDGGFFVADDGPGIPADQRDAVLEWGESADPDGTGLGLAIVDQIARAHDWTVTVGESESGGARFEVTPA
jgi:PAS domain S-box-containing protein